MLEASCPSTPLLHPAGLRAATRASYNLVTALGGGAVHARPVEPSLVVEVARLLPLQRTCRWQRHPARLPANQALASPSFVARLRPPALGYYVREEGRKHWTLDRSTAEVFGRDDFNGLAPAPSTHASQVSSSRCSVLPSYSVAERLGVSEGGGPNALPEPLSLLFT